jgi:hypothetical protein
VGFPSDRFEIEAVFVREQPQVVDFFAGFVALERHITGRGDEDFEQVDGLAGHCQ